VTDPTDPATDSTITVPVEPVDSAALPAGYKVFEYRIEKMLGGGGFGLTYLAHDVNLELPIALKEYYPGDLAMRSTGHSVQVRAAEGATQFAWGLERFLDEARALASFRHPNIVRVLRYFKENGTAYIVMEYESGDPLKRWLSRQSVFDHKNLLKLVCPLMDGLEAVHKMNFLHRDIKPDNIYIRADGSPVLLDFGAARRVTANRDMTNIISPGFAPFEQYHSQGNQGPWTDIYSLGAVMYWIVTGQKPMESASRVKQDIMPKAVEAGKQVFGESILRAIDWAMTPDEAKRPQTVSEFRAALIGAGDASPQLLVAGNAVHETRSNNDVLAFAANSQSFPQSQSESMRKNVMGTLMFMDLVAFSKFPMEQQVTVKARFNEITGKALKGILESSRIVIDTGDGAAVCFLGDPEEALQSALLLRGLLTQKYKHTLSVRIGLHLGPIRMVFDINNRVNVVGDGINVAQRIMDFAHPNQIVVSRAFYDVVSCISDMSAGLFSHLGAHLDKHLRSHDIYAVLDPQTATASPAASIDAFENTATFPVMVSLTLEMASDIEIELARLIGPLAKVLVKKAVPRAISAPALRELLSVSIPDPTAREAFAKGKTSTHNTTNHSTTSHSTTNSHGGSGNQNNSHSGGHTSSRRAESQPSQFGGLRSDPGQTGKRSDQSQPAALMHQFLNAIPSFSRRAESQPSQFGGLRSDPGQTGKRGDQSQPAPSAPHFSNSIPFPSRDVVSHPTTSHPVSSPANSSRSYLVTAKHLSPEQFILLEKVLSHYIGPMARMIIKKEAQRHASLADLLVALPQHIDKAEEREKFAAAVQKLHLVPR
jgi:serine/threonine protein kinase